MKRDETRLRIPIVAVLAFLSFPQTSHAEQRRPNVLFIMSDDLNTALSGMGHPECKTPNLDALAGTGVTFTRAFCQFPLCGPSRASVMTGQYPIANGVVGNGGTVDPKRVTLPRHFGEHGYWTARVSKIYHMGIPGDIVEGKPGRDHGPSWGETHNIAALETLTPGIVENFTEPDAITKYLEERARWKAAQKLGKQYLMPKFVRGDYAVVEVEDGNVHLLPDTMTADKAIDLLQQRAERPEPLFLAVGFVRPHFPFVSTERSLSPYQSEALALPDFPEDDHADMPPQSISTVKDFNDEPIQKLRRGYYGAIGFMDQQVGRLLAELERLNLRDNTIVVFVSDHGYLLGEHRMWKKSKLWEEAIRVPLIISAPGKKQGAVCDHYVELVDLYPTLTELASLPPDSGVQGQSLVALLDDPEATLPRSDAFIQTGSGYGLRTDKWAYMWYPVSKKHKDEGYMLYDMEQDPSQYTNLASNPEYASTRKRLHARLTKRIKAAKN
jgi:arylsulfatase A-like enzyme